MKTRPLERYLVSFTLSRRSNENNVGGMEHLTGNFLAARRLKLREGFIVREKMLINGASRLILLVVGLQLLWLVPFLSSGLRNADAAVTTAISPTGGTGSPASLGTTITSGTSTSPTNLCTANCVITGGTRVGTNLFQSFGLFSIGGGDIATFQNVKVNGAFPLTTNILSRVTDGQPSQIFGTLRTADFGNANLFLMNPAGIVFGPNATLNVGGSVAFTTANKIKLTSGWLFDKTSDPSAVPLLSSAPVASFGFLGSTVAPITVYGMTVQGPMPTDGTGAPLGQKVTLVGGDIKFTSYSDPTTPNAPSTPSVVTAPGRQIQITSVAGPGEVAVDTLIPTMSMAMGTITLDSGTVISTAGNPSFGDGSGGAITIRGGQFVATGATITTSPAAGTFGTGGAVTVEVAGSATFTDSTIQTSPVLDFSLTGSGGAVSITADQGLAMTRTTIDASAFFAGGDAGSVTLNSLYGPVSLTDSVIATQASAPGNGGAVTITGKDVTLTRSAISTGVDTGIFDFTIDDPSLGLVHPGAVTVTAQNTVTFSGSLPGGDPLNPIPVISATAFGTLLDAGSVTITGKTVNLSNGSIVTTMNEGQIPSPGNGGPIEIRGNNVSLSQFTLQSLNMGFTASTGKGGNILLRGADNLLANNIQLIGSTVNAGSVTGGGAGNIEIQTKALTLSASRIQADTLGIGPGGSVSVHGAQTVDLEANSVMSASAVSSGAGSQGPFGSGGSVLLETQQLTMQGGSRLRSADLPTSQGNAGSITVQGTNGPAQSILIDGAGTGIFTDAESTGAGGNISLSANIVTLQNNATVSASTSGNAVSAKGGSITVNAGEVQMRNGASISAKSTGLGDAGDITVNAGTQLVMTGNSSITTSALSAGGGNITITASDLVRAVNSQITASVQGGTGNGGNISIDPNVVILQNSQIIAQAVQGNGGNIMITTPLFLADQTSLVSASSQFGLNGTVTIQSPTSNLAGSVASLPSSMRQAQGLQTGRCAALANSQSSSLIIAGRETIPTEPGGWLPSPFALAETDSGPFADAAPQTTSQLAMAADTVSLRRLTPAGFLTKSFAENASTGCRS